MSAPDVPTLNDLAQRLSEMWDAELCDWKLRFEPKRFGSLGEWTLDLEWTQEYGNAHHADWATHTWSFYALIDEGDGPEQAFAQAVLWCEQLSALRTEA